MKKIQISLISKQTIPNLKLIKEFQKEVDLHIFITTKEMELDNKSDDIINAAKLSHSKVQKIRVNPNALSDIENELLKIEERSGYEYLVNITGGTKLMSIAALNYFDEFKNVKIFYVPIGGEFYRQIFPRIENPEKKFTIKLSLSEFLIAQGMQILKKENKTFSKKLSEKLLNKVIKYNSDFSQIKELSNPHNYNKASEKVFYSGKWFEEFVYLTIKDYLKLNNSEISTSVKIQRHNARNEFDVMFIYKNQIYVIECKAHHGGSNIFKKIESGLYKLGALDDDFGLKAHSAFITTFNIKNYDKNDNLALNNRANDLGVNLLQYHHLKNLNNLIYQILK